MDGPSGSTLANISDSFSPDWATGGVPGNVPGMGNPYRSSSDVACLNMLIFRAAAAFLARSERSSCLEGAQRPSVCQFGSGRSNKDDLLDAVSERFLVLDRLVCLVSLDLSSAFVPFTDFGGIRADGQVRWI